MDATVDATILRLGSGDTSPIHQFPPPEGGTTKSYPASGTASGIGDVLVRTKYRLTSTRGGGIAAALDVRLKSGDAANLLGTGSNQVSFVFIGSTTAGRLAPHFNAGYTKVSSGGVVTVPDEFGYRLGTEFIVTPTATLSVELIGRTLRDPGTGRLELAETNYTFHNAANQQFSRTLTEFVSRPGSLNLASLGLGGKFNIAGTFLITADVLVALTSAGVTARITPVVGFSYSF
jgi:hypothetical protein